MLCWNFSASAQIKFDDAMRKNLHYELLRIDNLLDSKWMFEGPDSHNEPNLNIRNLLTRERITDRNYMSDQFGIYSFNSSNNISHVFLINGDKYSIIEMGFPTYEQIIEKVLKYFRKNPEVDKRLLPLYIQKITLQYLWNHGGYDDFGPWRKWFDKNTTDSIALKYRDYLYLGRDN